MWWCSEGLLADDNVPGKIAVDDATLAQQQVRAIIMAGVMAGFCCL
jgi:hypothetical protein